MSSIDQRIQTIKKDLRSDGVGYTIDPKTWINLPEKLKNKLREIDPNSRAVSLIGEKCFFCKHEITKRDVTPPNQVYDSQLGHTCHGKCLDYIIKKYPQVPMNQLEGQIVRVKGY